MRINLSPGKLSIIVLLTLSSCISRHKEVFYEGSVTFPDTLSLEKKEYLAAHVVPQQKQIEWQEMEMSAFIHFSVNTFTDKEWGDGKEPESVFNPTDLNAFQWVKELDEAGFRMVILTAKHHDGFCLWPTKTTTHSVKNSPWMNGRGDVVRELKTACDRYGMRFGIYISPWDRNAKCYGDSPEYNKFFMAQLTELLTWYGKVDEIWFDGACGEGPNGKKQEYDWKGYYSLIHKLQPDAVVAVMGEDIRWVGTESGYGRETEWSATPFAPGGRPEMTAINKKLGLEASSEDLGSDILLRKADRVFWYPSEVDVSIRPGWFYHSTEDNRVKSADKLADIYFNSVGRNSLLLLNVPPDRRGLIGEKDIQSLKGFKRYLDTLYSRNLLEGSRPYGHGASYAIDRKITTSWKPDSNAVVSYITPIPVTFNVLELCEDISKGQRVEGFKVEAKKGENWFTVASGTTVGYKRLIRFPAVTSDEIRLSITASRSRPNISTFALFRAPEIMGEALLQRDREGHLTICSDSPFSVIKYTTDGTDPTRSSETWKNPVPLPGAVTVKSRVYINNFADSGSVVTENYDIAPSKWSIVKADPSIRGCDAENAIDGNDKSVYRTTEGNDTGSSEHNIIIDLGENLKINGFYYTPASEGYGADAVEKYRFYVSTDGKKWLEVKCPGEFGNTGTNPVKQSVMFSRPYQAHFLRFTALSAVNGSGKISIAEIGVITR
jgi:alpha-L-fucosidase